MELQTCMETKLQSLQPVGKAFNKAKGQVYLPFGMPTWREVP